MQAIRISVTGGMGCGKSTLCRGLANAARMRHLTVYVIEVDALRARMLEDTHRSAYRRLQEKIVLRFGAAVRNARGGVDRFSLSQIAYRNLRVKKQLDAIIDPALRQEIEKEVRGKDGLVLIDYALAVEKNLLALSDYNSLLVECMRSTQLQRLSPGDLPLWQIKARLLSQFSSCEEERRICSAQKNAGRGFLFKVWNEETLSEWRCMRLLDRILEANREEEGEQ